MENGMADLGDVETEESRAQLVGKIIRFAESEGNLLLKFSSRYLTESLNVHKLHRISKFFRDSQKKIDLEVFVAIFSSIISHTEDQTLFLVMSLMDIYKQVSEKKQATRNSSVQFNDFTDLFCEEIVERDPYLVLPEKQNSPNQVPDMAVSPFPCVRYLCPTELPVLSKSMNSREKTLKSPINQCVVAKSLKKVIALSLLSSRIEIFCVELSKWKQIKPKISKSMKKQFVILSCGYDERNKRIGLVVKNVGLIFCEAADNFETEKIIEGVVANRILYVGFLQCWATVNRNCLAFWNLNEEKQIFEITVDEAAYLNCLEEIDHLQKLVVSYTYSNQSRWLHVYHFNSISLPQQKKWTLITKLQICSSGCHTLHYNPNTQSLIRLGYLNTVIVSQIDQLSFQIIKISELEGHRSIVTAVTTIPSTSVIVTGDDQGYVRLWDLAYMRCYQVLRLSREIKMLSCFEGWLLFGDKRINMIPIDLPKYDKNSEGGYFIKYYNELFKNLFIFSHNSCLNISMETGKLLQIFVLCQNEQEITCVSKLKNAFCLGTNKGNIILYNFKFQKKKQYKISEDSILSIKSDHEQIIMIIMANDGTITLWMQEQNFEEGCRKKLTGFSHDSLDTTIEFSHRDGLIALTQHSSQVFFLDYEAMKITCKIITPFPFSIIRFHPNLPVLFFISEDGFLAAIEYQKEEMETKIINVVNLEWTGIARMQEQTVTVFNIGKKNRASIGTSKGNFFILDLQELLKQVYREKEIKFSERPAVYHRLIRERMDEKKYKNRIYKIQNKNNLHRLQIPVILRRNLTKRNSITHVDISEENNFISILCCRGIFRIFELQNLRCIALRKGKNINPQKWEPIKPNTDFVREKIVGAIKLLQNIFNYPFQTGMRAEIDMKGLSIEEFMTQIFKKSEKGSAKHRISRKERINMGHSSRRYRYSEANNENVPLKYMEIEKRVKQIQEVKEKSMSIPIKSKYSLSNHLREVTQDQFFKPCYREKLGKIFNKPEESCSLWNKIERKFSSLQNLHKSTSKLNAQILQSKTNVQIIQSKSKSYRRLSMNNTHSESKLQKKITLDDRNLREMEFNRGKNYKERKKNSMLVKRFKPRLDSMELKAKMSFERINKITC